MLTIAATSAKVLTVGVAMQGSGEPQVQPQYCPPSSPLLRHRVNALPSGNLSSPVNVERANGFFDIASPLPSAPGCP